MLVISSASTQRTQLIDGVMQCGADVPTRDDGLTPTNLVTNVLHGLSGVFDI